MERATRPRRRNVVNAASAVGAAALIAGGVALASMTATGTTDPGDRAADNYCIYDEYDFVGDRPGRLDTPAGSFRITGVSLNPTTDGALCGYLSTTTISADEGDAQPTNYVFAISEGAVDEDSPRFTPEMYLRVDHPNGVSAQGTLRGVNDGDEMVFSGTLFDVDNGVPSVTITDLSIESTDDEIRAGDFL